MQFRLHILIISRFCSTNLSTKVGFGLGGVNRSNATRYNTSPSGNTTDVRESHLQKALLNHGSTLQLIIYIYIYIHLTAEDQAGRGVLENSLHIYIPTSELKKNLPNILTSKVSCFCFMPCPSSNLHLSRKISLKVTFSFTNLPLSLNYTPSHINAKSFT